MKYQATYIGYATDKYAGVPRLWKINDKEIVLKLSKKYKEVLEKNLQIIDDNLKTGLPLTEVTDELKVFNVLEIIRECFVDEFMLYVESYFKNKLSNGINVTLVDFLNECICITPQPLSMLSRDHAIELREHILQHLTDGRIEELDIKFHFQSNMSMIYIAEAIGLNNFLRVIYQNYRDSLERYIEGIYKFYSVKRELLSYSQFAMNYLALGTSGSEEIREYSEKIKEIVVEIRERFGDELIKSNLKYLNNLNISDDVWVMYYREKNLNISSTSIDFSDILSEKFKVDFKYYFKNALAERSINSKNFKGILSSFNTCKRGANFIFCGKRGRENFEEIEPIDCYLIYGYMLNEVTNHHNGEQLSIATVSKAITLYKKIVDYLIENKNPRRSNPKYNYFRDIEIKNIDNMCRSIDVIPEFVSNQLDACIGELNVRYERIYHIFNSTAMRLKEVCYLEPDCLEGYDENVENDNTIYLKFVPYKVLISRKRKGKYDRHTVVIPRELAKIIDTQIKESEELRRIHKSPYIFIAKNRGKVRVIGQGFCAAMNRIIKKNNICDCNGELWRFDSRQMRATVAAIMIENGATSNEIMSLLNHLAKSTLDKHYKKVEKKKLAEMNNEFFKKEFRVTVKEENLALYTEEERRQLYIDFALSTREVEFGQCSKHISEGPCNKRSGKISCANCPKICTGKRYIKKWISLRDNQQCIINELRDGYKKLQINFEEYSDFLEYKKELNQLEIYNSVIRAIEGE